MRAAYVLGAPNLYFKPLIDASVTRIDLDGLHEWGGGAADLIVRGSGQTVLTVTPALEMGTALWLGNGMVVRAFMRGGASWYGGNDLALAASFAAAPDSVGSFTMVTRMDDVMGVLGAGLDIITSSDSALRFAYDGQFGETTQTHSIGIKGSLKY